MKKKKPYGPTVSAHGPRLTGLPLTALKLALLLCFLPACTTTKKACLDE